MRSVRFVALAVAGALAIMCPRAASAASIDCSFLSLAQVAQGKNANTTSKNFVDLAGSEVSFENSANCIMIEFSAEVSAAAPQALRVRVELDPAPADTRTTRANADTIVPTSMDFYSSSRVADARATVFVVRNPNGGDRTLRLQFMSVNGGPVTLETWTMTVRYNTRF
jgi:hypothetical protein